MYCFVLEENQTLIFWDCQNITLSIEERLQKDFSKVQVQVLFYSLHPEKIKEVSHKQPLNSDKGIAGKEPSNFNSTHNSKLNRRNLHPMKSGLTLQKLILWYLCAGWLKQNENGKLELLLFTIVAIGKICFNLLQLKIQVISLLGIILYWQYLFLSHSC